MKGLSNNTIYNDDEKESDNVSSYKLAQNLFKDSQVDRHTYLTEQEISILSLLKLLGEVQDEYRKKYLEITDKCNLTKLVDSGLRMRTSIRGWRSEQVVRILESKSIQQNLNSTDQNIVNPDNIINKK